jgi:hypothetical protein
MEWNIPIKLPTSLELALKVAQLAKRIELTLRPWLARPSTAATPSWERQRRRRLCRRRRLRERRLLLLCGGGLLPKHATECVHLRIFACLCETPSCCFESSFEPVPSLSWQIIVLYVDLTKNYKGTEKK